MAQEEKPLAEWTDEEKYFQPEWLETARSEMNEAMENMTIEERMRYIDERARQFRSEQNERMQMRRS